MSDINRKTFRLVLVGCVILTCVITILMWLDRNYIKEINLSSGDIIDGMEYHYYIPKVDIVKGQDNILIDGCWAFEENKDITTFDCTLLLYDEEDGKAFVMNFRAEEI